MDQREVFPTRVLYKHVLSELGLISLGVDSLALNFFLTLQLCLIF